MRFSIVFTYRKKEVEPIRQSHRHSQRNTKFQNRMPSRLRNHPIKIIFDFMAGELQMRVSLSNKLGSDTVGLVRMAITFTVDHASPKITQSLLDLLPSSASSEHS